MSTEPRRKDDDCEHREFWAHVDVTRLEDSGAFMADIQIKCIECGMAFTFPPLPHGLNCSEARINIDATMLRLPIKPYDEAAFRSFIGIGGFDIKAAM